MERELKNAVRNRVKAQVLDGLIKANDIEVPAAVVDGEIDVLRRQAAQRFGGDENKRWNYLVNCLKNKQNVA